MSTNKKFRIQNGVDVTGEVVVGSQLVITDEGKVVVPALSESVATIIADDIAHLQAQIDAILGTSPESLDTLQEIVAFFNTEDGDLQTLITNNSTAIATINTTLTNGVATPTDIATLTASVTAEVARATAAEAANAAAIAAANSRTSGISTSSGAADIKMTAEVDMDSNNIKNANDVYAARGFIDTIESNDLKVQTGTVDFEGSIVNFGSSQIIGSGFGTATKAEVDAHLNKSTANTGEFVKWNGTDYEWTDLLSGRLATNQLQVASGGSITATGPGGTFDFQDGIVMLSGSDVRVDTPTDVGQAANKGYVDGVVAATVDAAPAALDTLNELAAALGDDANFSATVTNSIATKADDAATTAALATKANDAATTAALALKEDKTTVTTLDTFVKGSSTSATYGVVDGDNIDPEWKNQDSHSWVGSNSGYGNGIDLTTSSESKAWISLPAGTHQFLYKSIGPSGLGVSLFVIPESGDQNGNLVSQAIVKNENTLENSSPYWEYTVTEPVKLVVTNPVLSAAVGNGHRTFTEMSVVVGTPVPSLETTSTQVVPAINELHTELDALVLSQSGDQSNLQAQVTAEVARATSAEAVNAANIVSETSARSSADAALESDIIGLQNQVGTIISGSPASLDTLVEIVSAFENADSDLSGVITANGGRLTTAENNITALETDLSAEESARGAGDDALQTQVTAHDGRLTTAEGEIDTLQSQMATRIGSDSDQSAALAVETAARIAGDNANSAEVTAEASARSAADTQLTSDLSTEVARATQAEGQIASDLAQEVIDRQNADTGLQTQIDFIKENTDPASLDSLTEIVAAFQSADGSITGVVNSNTGRISALESGVVAIEAWDTDNVSEGSINKYWTEQRTKDCLSGGLCVTYSSVTGEIKIDEVEAESSLRVAESVASDDADKLGGAAPSHYRIDIYDVNGTVVN